MKKKIISWLLIVTMLIPGTSLTGCGNNGIKQTKESIDMELGQSLDFDLNDVFEVKGGVDASEVDLDTSNINTKELGSYDMIVTFNKGNKKEKSYTLTVNVVDTTAPTLATSDLLNDGITYLNNITDFDKYFKATDLTETHIEVKFARLGEAEALSEEVVNKYKEMVTEEKDTTDADKDGYYKATAYGVDTSGNRSEGYSWLVVYDKTAPEIYVDDKKVSDGDSVDYDVNGIKNHINIKDNMSVNLNEMAQLEDDNGKITISVMDTCGNETKLSLNGKKSSASNKGSSGGSSRGSSSNDSDSKSSSKKSGSGKYSADGYEFIYYSDGSGIAGAKVKGYFWDSRGNTIRPDEELKFSKATLYALDHPNEVFWIDGESYVGVWGCAERNDRICKGSLNPAANIVLDYCKKITGRTDIISPGWDEKNPTHIFKEFKELHEYESDKQMIVVKGIGFTVYDPEAKMEAWYDLKEDGSYEFEEWDD